MKILNYLIIAVFAMTLIGCSASNWNLGKQHVVQKKPKTAQTTTAPKADNQNNQTIVKPQIQEETIAINEPIEENTENEKISELFEGINLEENQATADDKLAMQNAAQNDNTTTVTSAGAATSTVAATNSIGAYHISAVIKAWGEPDKKRANGEYIWKSCTPTGEYEQVCDDNSCNTVPKTSCCDRVLKTDSGGYVTNLKEAVQKCR
ncbi:MAG: hypothetical protein MR902_01035 [Campylobacter sp.]|nr:hypothetical protein [Campylobacter sp.]